MNAIRRCLLCTRHTFGVNTHTHTHTQETLEPDLSRSVQTAALVILIRPQLQPLRIGQSHDSEDRCSEASSRRASGLPTVRPSVMESLLTAGPVACPDWCGWGTGCSLQQEVCGQSQQEPRVSGPIQRHCPRPEWKGHRPDHYW